MADGRPATEASLFYPTSAALDSAGNLYVADTAHHRIRRIGADGVIMTVAGDGVAGFSGDGGPATGARLNWPRGVAVQQREGQARPCPTSETDPGATPTVGGRVNLVLSRGR